MTKMSKPVVIRVKGSKCGESIVIASPCVYAIRARIVVVKTHDSFGQPQEEPPRFILQLVLAGGSMSADFEYHTQAELEEAEKSVCLLIGFKEMFLEGAFDHLEWKQNES